MTDSDLVLKKLAAIEDYCSQLRRLAQLEKLEVDVKEERFVCHTLQLALQAMLDVASHIVADDRLGEPQSLRDLFAILAKNGRLNGDLAAKLAAAAGLRNLLVHEYGQINLAIIREVVVTGLGDLEAFCTQIRDHL